MKLSSPYSAGRRIEAIAHLLYEVLPPHERWLPAALLMRVRDPETSLDRLLGLTGNGGRGFYLGCNLPERDRRLRELADTLPEATVKARAETILARQAAGDPAVLAIHEIAALPRSRRQLERILSA